MSNDRVGRADVDDRNVDYDHNPQDTTASRLFDLRTIIGALFVLYGVILFIAGLFDSDEEIAKADGIRINIWLGLAMFVLGALFLLWVAAPAAARRAPARPRPSRPAWRRGRPRSDASRGLIPASHRGRGRDAGLGLRGRAVEGPWLRWAARRAQVRRASTSQEEAAVAQPERRPVVLVAEELAPSALDVLSADFELRHVDGADRSALLPALAGVDAVLIRSATKIDAEALAAADRLKVVARAGIGLDNVDVPAATARGVMVVNAPTSNIVSAAEHASRCCSPCARNVAGRERVAAGRGSGSGRTFTGVEVADKTVGVVGLGRIGVLVAQRLSAFGVRLLAYDPYVQPARAAQIGVRLVGLEELLRAERLHHHPPAEDAGDGRPDRRPRAGRWPSRACGSSTPPAAGWCDEDALADAIRSGQVAGAGIDVFVTEPATDSPLFGLPGVVVTPHLGASTVEAQDKAGLAVARSVRLALQGEFVPDAVNVQAGGTVAEERPARAAAGREARPGVHRGWPAGSPQSITVEVRGEIAAHDVSVLQLAALKGVFADVVSEQVTFVNAPLLAKDRGVDVGLATYAESEDYRNLVTVRGVLPTGEPVSVSGTLTGPKQVEKLTEVDGFDVELRLEGHLLFFRYTDRPGVVGVVGARLGDAGVNIAGAQVSRTRRGGEALMAVTVDSAVPAEVLVRHRHRRSARPTCAAPTSTPSEPAARVTPAATPAGDLPVRRPQRRVVYPSRP